MYFESLSSNFIVIINIGSLKVSKHENNYEIKRFWKCLPRYLVCNEMFQLLKPNLLWHSMVKFHNWLKLFKTFLQHDTKAESMSKLATIWNSTWKIIDISRNK